MGSDNFSWR